MFNLDVLFSVSNIILFMKSGTVEVQQISGGQRLNMHGLENSS